MFRRLVRWVPALAWMTVIFVLSATPGSRLPGRFSTLAHFLTYAVLGGLLVLAMGTREPYGRSVAVAVILASLYGITDEFHQSFVPMRTPDVADWGVDTLGAFVGAWATAWLAVTVVRRGRGAAGRATPPQ